MIISEKKENPLFSVHDSLAVKLITRLRLEFSHLNELKFRHGFKDTLNPLCTCRAKVETTFCVNIITKKKKTTFPLSEFLFSGKPKCFCLHVKLAKFKAIKQYSSCVVLIYGS